MSIAVHLLVLVALLWPRAAPSLPSAAPAAIEIILITSVAPAPPGPPDSYVDANQLHAVMPPIPPLDIALTPIEAITLPRVPDTSDLLSESQLSGAAQAGLEQGGGGQSGACNTAQALQQALRGDPMVQTAVTEAGRQGKAVMLWNGDWVRAGNQEGKGLSGVRQAILWALAFAPQACRETQVRGLVLLSLVDGTRFAIGTQAWRWSDLLGLDRAGSSPAR